MPTHGGNHIKERIALRSRIQDICSRRAWIWQASDLNRPRALHPSALPARWQDKLAENPERANICNGNRCKVQVREQDLRA